MAKSQRGKRRKSKDKADLVSRERQNLSEIRTHREQLKNKSEREPTALMIAERLQERRDRTWVTQRLNFMDHADSKLVEAVEKGWLPFDPAYGIFRQCGGKTGDVNKELQRKLGELAEQVASEQGAETSEKKRWGKVLDAIRQEVDLLKPRQKGVVTLPELRSLLQIIRKKVDDDGELTLYHHGMVHLLSVVDGQTGRGLFVRLVEALKSGQFLDPEFRLLNPTRNT